jgi:SOS-response transcriptional repressor LexA
MSTQPEMMVPIGVFPEGPGLFARRVVGDYLTGDRLREGDYVVFDPARPLADGDIAAVEFAVRGKRALVVAHVRTGVVRGGFVLECSNPVYHQAIIPPGAHPAVEGVAVGVARWRGGEWKWSRLCLPVSKAAAS